MTVYATADQLASALHVAVSAKNAADLDACVSAASEEIDHYVDFPDGVVFPDPAPALVNRVCVARWLNGGKPTTRRSARWGSTAPASSPPPRTRSPGTQGT